MKQPGRGDEDAGGQVELAADHQHADPDGHDADRRGLVEDGEERAGRPEGRRDDEEEDEDDDRRDEGADLGAGQQPVGPAEGDSVGRLGGGRGRGVGFDGGATHDSSSAVSAGAGLPRQTWTGPDPWRRLASVLLDEREDLGDVRLVDEGGAGQHGLAATEDVAVLLVEVELRDGHVALQVGLLVDEPLDLAVLDRLGRIRVGVERADLHVRPPGALGGLDRVEGLRRAEGDDPVDRLVLGQLGLDGAGDGGVVGAVDLQVLGVREGRP